MYKFSFGLFCVLSLLSLAGPVLAKPPADSKIENLWASPTPTGLYLVEQVTQKNQKMLRIGFCRGPEQPFWDQVFGKAKSAVTLGDVLYVAFEDGTILQPGGHVLEKLPGNAIPERLFTDQKQNRLFILAQQSDIPLTTTRSSTGPATLPRLRKDLNWNIYEMVSGKWVCLPRLPKDINSLDPPGVLADNGRVDIFAFSEKMIKSEIRRWSFQDGKWLRQPTLSPGLKIRNVTPLALNGLPVLVLSISGSQGDQLFSWPLPGGPEIFGPLKIGAAGTGLKTKYAVTAETDRILVAVVGEGQKQIQLSRWTKEGQPVGKVETVNHSNESEKQDNAIFFTLLLAAVLLTVFLARTKTVFVGETLPVEMMLPAYWRRAIAFGIDFLLTYFVVFIFLLFFWYDQFINLFDEQVMRQYMETGRIDTRMYVFVLVICTVFAAYCMVMEGFMGWTIGKWLLGLEVRQARQVGERPTWLQVFLRNLIKILEMNLWPLLFVMLLTRSRQRMGDLLAGTIVLQRSPKSEPIE
jgi:uncharacterized RDD family membrane protein YckC